MTETGKDDVRSTRAESPFDEWAILGGLRFFLALIVLFGHTTDFTAPDHRVMWTALGNFMHPSAAVLAFFMISGYSMAHSIRKPAGFYRRRFWRIYPVYASSLLFGLVVVWLAGGLVHMPGGQRIDLPDSLSFVRNLFFMQGWNTRRLIINGPLWSLSIEAFYYALTPLFARMRPGMLCSLIGISALYFWYCPLNLLEHPHGRSMIGFAWPWLAGFYWYRYRSDWLRIAMMGVGCLFALEKYGALAPVTLTVGWAIVTSASTVPVARWLRTPLNYLGELSYPLYAFHWPAIVGLYALGHVSAPAAWVSGGLCAGLIGYHAIDQRFRKVRLFRSAKPSPSIAARAGQYPLPVS